MFQNDLRDNNFLKLLNQELNYAVVNPHKAPVQGASLTAFGNEITEASGV